MWLRSVAEGDGKCLADACLKNLQRFETSVLLWRKALLMFPLFLCCSVGSWEIKLGRGLKECRQSKPLPVYETAKCISKRLDYGKLDCTPCFINGIAAVAQ